MARGKQEPGQFLVDGIGTFDAGMNSGLAPQLIPPNQASMATNMTFRGGYGTHRPTIREIAFDFGGDAMLEENVIHKAFQGACFYQPDTGAQSLVAAIGGRLFQFFPSGISAKTLDVSVPGDPNPASPQQAWLWQSERFVIWNDGVSLPVFFDGAISRRSNGTGKVLATISGSFVTPAVGATVAVTVTSPYTGPVNIPVLVNGAQFVLLSVGSTTSPSATLIKIYDPDGAHGVGESVIAYSDRIGTLLQDIPVGTKTITVLTSNLINNSNQQVRKSNSFTTFVSIGNEMFVLGNAVQQPDGNLMTTLTKFSLFSEAETTLNDHPVGQIITVQSSAPSPTVGTLAVGFTVGNIVDIAINPTYTGPQQVVWIGNGQYTIVQKPQTTTNIVTLQNVTGNPGDPMTGNIVALPELPPGRMGAYGMGRNWMALTDGFSFIASDIDGGTSGTEVYNFRDAPLRVTENTYLAGGGAFRVPGALGDIRAMRFSATLDVSLGQGPLQVFTTQAAFSCAAPTDRTTWGMLTNPILTQSLLGAGALSQNGTTNVNGDILFRSIDGIRSLILARRDFDTWGNVPQSREVETILANDNATLVQFESLVQFDNRALLSILPTNGPLGVFHQGVIALNEDPISTLRGKAPSIYDGLWTGLNVLQLVSGTFNGVERCYAFCYDSVLSRIRLFEIQKTGDAAFDNNTTPITYSFESAALFNNPKTKNQFDLAELQDGEIYISDIRGVANFEVWWKNNYSDCWNKWIDFGVCGNNTNTSKPLQYRAPLGLGTPPVEICDPNTKMPARIGLDFQVRIQITGSCKFRGAKFKATLVPETRFSVPLCKPLCVAVQDSQDCESCTDITDCIQFPLVLYNLNANKTYQNDLIAVQVTCPNGSVETVVVPAGTISYTLPFPPGFTGDYPPLVLNCLSGGVIVRTIPTGSTQEAIDEIVNGMISDCVQAYAESIANCQQVLFNAQVSVEHPCAIGTTLQFSGTLPSWITIDTGTSTVIGAAGTISSAISVADATANAQTQLQSWVDANLSNGNLACVSPSSVCTDGIAALLNNTYAIQGYFDGLIDNSLSDPSVFPVWDGTFIYSVGDGNPLDGDTGWANGGTAHHFSIQNKKACSAKLFFVGCSGDVPQWQLTVTNIDDNTLWQGNKSGGETPAGIFTQSAGIDAGPATITVELLGGVSTPEDGNLSCVT